MAEGIQTPVAWQRAGDNTTALVATLLVVDSLHFVWARTLLPYLPPLASAMFVLAIGAAQITLFNLINHRRHISWRNFRRHIGFYLGIGLLVAVSTGLNYGAVALIDPGTASMLGKTGILFGIALSIVWLHDRLNRTQAIGALIALGGVFVISFHPGENSQVGLGALMVLASAFLYALHTAVVKRFGDAIDFTEFFMYRLLTTTVFLLLLTLLRGEWVWPAPRVWLLLLVVGSVDVVISRALYYAALRRLSMSTHTVILMLSPVIAVIWSILLFNSWPTPQEIAGGLAVLAGIVVVTSGHLQSPRTTQ